MPEAAVRMTSANNDISFCLVFSTWPCSRCSPGQCMALQGPTWYPPHYGMRNDIRCPTMQHGTPIFCVRPPSASFRCRHLTLGFLAPGLSLHKCISHGHGWPAYTDNQEFTAFAIYLGFSDLGFRKMQSRKYGRRGQLTRICICRNPDARCRRASGSAMLIAKKNAGYLPGTGPTAWFQATEVGL
jgi:hypothetical protein